MSDDLREDYLSWKPLPGGLEGAVVPLTFGRARIVVGPSESYFYDDGW